MAKKAKNVSWRTLARQAEKQKNPGEAAWLRRKSAALRRADRATKVSKKKAAPAARRDLPGAVRATNGWATRRANEAKKAMEAGGLGALAAQAPATQQGVERVALTPTERGAPGHGELVGGAFSQLADRLTKLARKKGGTDAIQNELAALAASSKYEGSVETDKAATKRLLDVQQIIADRIVCGFLAEIEHTMNFHRGLPPGMVHTIDSFTITKIVDALNKAGYRPQGKVNTGSVMGADKAP